MKFRKNRQWHRTALIGLGSVLVLSGILFTWKLLKGQERANTTATEGKATVSQAQKTLGIYLMGRRKGQEYTLEKIGYGDKKAVLYMGGVSTGKEFVWGGEDKTIEPDKIDGFQSGGSFEYREDSIIKSDNESLLAYSTKEEAQKYVNSLLQDGYSMVEEVYTASGFTLIVSNRDKTMLSYIAFIDSSSTDLGTLFTLVGKEQSSILHKQGLIENPVVYRVQ